MAVVTLPLTLKLLSKVPIRGVTGQREVKICAVVRLSGHYDLPVRLDGD
jgi:hypothetical protein